MTALAFAAMLVWSLAMLVLVGSATCALLHPRLARRQASHRARPPVSIVIPLKADGAGLGLATASAAALAYPACDITLCAADAASPALAVARRALGACLVPWRVAISRDGEGNPKVANIAAALGSARADLVLVKDAGTILPPNALDAMVAALDGPVGLVVAVPLARDADGLAAEVEAAFLNGYGARMVLAASALGLGVGIGAAMLFRRGDLARADGLRAMAGSVADDHALAKAMARIGLATRCASVPVWQAVGRRDMADVWTRHRRWAICRRMEEPLAFHAEPCLGAAMACLSAGIAAPALGVGPGAAVAATIATWILVEAGIAAAKGWPLTVAMPLALVIREAMMPAVWIAALCARSIAWGDRRLVLGPDRSGRRGLT